MNKFLSLALLGLVALTPATPANASVKIGILSCSVDGGIGYIIGSSKGVECVFEPSNGNEPEQYTGRIGKFGLDVGVTNRAVLAWAVFAPGRTDEGALEGSYTGASAQATVGVGVGANVLIGGFRKTINLQPISVQAQTGLNIAAGISGLNLDYDGYQGK
jgi:Protein of unknown function (DUF992)